jgi:hypothetical protein
MHSTPDPTLRPCWHCTAFDGMTAQGTAALCSRPNGCRVRALPAAGCVSWVRAPGTDDEDWPPFVAPPDTEAWVPWPQRYKPLPKTVVIAWAP